jgi:hypothetical protein
LSHEKQEVNKIRREEMMNEKATKMKRKSNKHMFPPSFSHLLVVIVAQSDVTVGPLLQQPPRQQRLSLHNARLEM